MLSTSLAFICCVLSQTYLQVIMAEGTGLPLDVRPKDPKDPKLSVKKEDSEGLKDFISHFEKLSPDEKMYVSSMLDGGLRTARGSTTLTTTQLPRIAVFSGDLSGKDNVSYDLWKAEVNGLQKQNIYTEATILQAIRRSLRGKAADVVLHLGDTDVDSVLTKMDQIFGNVLPSENILEVFYTARQEMKEDISSWACRLEDLIAKLKQRKAISPEAAVSMLRTKFYSGLVSAHVKSAIRHKFDQNEDYSNLLISARVAELEGQSAKVHQVTATAMSPSEASKLDKVLASIEELNKRLEKLENNTQGSDKGHRGRRWRQKESTANQPSNNTQQHKQQQQPKQQTQQQPAPQPSYPAYQPNPTSQSFFPGNCYSCGGYGHRAVNCPLNWHQLT